MARTPEQLEAERRRRAKKAEFRARRPREITPLWAVNERAGDMRRSTAGLLERGHRIVWVQTGMLLDQTMPDQRLEKTRSGGPNAIGRRVDGNLFEWKEGVAIDPSEVYLAGDTIGFQDGRHRQLAAYLAGERITPVIVAAEQAQELMARLRGMPNRPPLTSAPGLHAMRTTAALKPRRLIAPADRLLDRLLVSHAINLRALERDTLKKLDRIYDRLADQLEEQVRGLEVNSLADLNRMERLSQEAKALRGVRERALQSQRFPLGSAQRDAAELASIGVSEAAAAAGSSMPQFGVLSAAQLRQVAKSRFVQGQARELLQKQAIKGALRLEESLRTSYLLGEGIDRAVARIRRVVEIDAAQARMIARTTLQTAANQATHETYKKAGSAVEYLIWVATLDSRTCPQCGALDGQRLDLERPHIMPPAHPNCRCTVIAKAKGLPAPKIPNWSSWIQKHGSSAQKVILGKTRYEALRAGVHPDQLIDKSGALKDAAAVKRMARKAAA